jgi:hypothetical protein
MFIDVETFLKQHRCKLTIKESVKIWLARDGSRVAAAKTRSMKEQRAEAGRALIRPLPPTAHDKDRMARIRAAQKKLDRKLEAAGIAPDGKPYPVFPQQKAQGMQ